MPCQGRPAVPRGSPCPKSPAQGCQQRGHVNLAASRCLSVPPLHAGVVAATHFPLHGAPAVTPQGCPGLPGAVWGCPGLPTPCMAEYSTSHSSCPWWWGAGAADLARQTPKPLGEYMEAGTAKDTSGQHLMPHGSSTSPSATLGTAAAP